jgi:hypothetical protein
MSPNLTLFRPKSPRTQAANALVGSVTPVAVVLFFAMTPILASERTDTQSGAAGVASERVAVTPKPAIEIVRGMVESVDEGNDTIEIRTSPETSQLFKVQDGLIFNAVRFGDQVKISVQEIAGAKTIVGLEKN